MSIKVSDKFLRGFIEENDISAIADTAKSAYNTLMTKSNRLKKPT